MRSVFSAANFTVRVLARDVIIAFGIGKIPILGQVSRYRYRNLEVFMLIWNLDTDDTDTYIQSASLIFFYKVYPRNFSAKVETFFFQNQFRTSKSSTSRRMIFLIGFWRSFCVIFDTEWRNGWKEQPRNFFSSMPEKQISVHKR